jgi:uroporphyrinogen-III synthase
MSNVRGLSAEGRALPLAGLSVAVTRAGERGSPLAAALRAVGATVHEVPLTRIESLDPTPLREAVRALARYDWVLLTSVNAVEHLATIVREERAGEQMEARRLAVVGAATAAAAERLGWRLPSVHPEKSQAEGMLDLMAARVDVEGARMLYPCAAGARDVLPDGLRALGAIVDVVPVYRSAPDPEGQARMRALSTAGQLDLVTVAQAVHWFDRPRFFREVERVLRPGGVLAIWSYGIPQLEGGAADALLQHFYGDVVGPYWPAEKALVESGYRDLVLPFESLPTPSFAMEAAWSLEQVLGYCASWSASARYRAALGSDPIERLRPALAAPPAGSGSTARLCWGDPRRG